MKDFFVYILKCSDNSLYTGFTNNLEKRIQAHNHGKNGAKYTLARRPVELVYSQKFETESDARKEEIRIKKLPRIQKLLLIGH